MNIRDIKLNRRNIRKTLRRDFVKLRDYRENWKIIIRKLSLAKKLWINFVKLKVIIW